MTKSKIQRNITRPIVMLSTIFIPVLMFVFIIVQGMAPHVAAAQSTEIETIATNDWQPSTDATVDKLSNSLVNINATQAVTTYTLYLPIIFKPLESPTLLSVSVPTSPGSLSSSQATASWTAVTNAVSYELEESQSADFSNSTIYDVGTVTSYDISHTSTWNNRFYYRVRAVGIVNSNWSNVLDQTYIMYDSFNDPTTGWAMRREDLDDVDNSTSYANGIFKMKIHGRWDSMIAGPLTPVPETWPGYAIDTRVILEDGIDNLHSYGIIFGGDWNGVSQCPNSTMTSCYNHFYRINVIWFGGPDKLRVSLKRIDYHNYATDKDVGQTLMGHRDIAVHDPDGWNDWSIQVRSNGVILVYLNGNLITSVNDTKYIGGGTYFGGFASSDEYLGTAAWYAYYRVRPLP
ncbi:MAG: hypothetical protein GY943_21705 [Chloroflexi bacterium]|nr:hypothetical protein [Chloroflexota bacterium]